MQTIDPRAGYGEVTVIWSSTNAGRITYASAEWATYTGQPVGDALGEGWLRMLHPEDRDATASFFEEACASVAPFTVRGPMTQACGFQDA